MALDLTGIPDEYANRILHSAQAERVRDVLATVADLVNQGAPITSLMMGFIVARALETSSRAAQTKARAALQNFLAVLSQESMYPGEAFAAWADPASPCWQDAPDDVEDAAEPEQMASTILPQPRLGMVGDPSAWTQALNGARVVPDPMSDAELKAVETMAREGHAADMAIMDSAEVLEGIGQIQALNFMKHVSEVTMAQVAAKIRSSKKYKGLPYHDENGNLKHVSDFEEFCRIKLGRTYRRVKQLLDNLHTLGPDLYEAAQVVGFKARDYKALHALPAEEQEIVKQALEAEDKGQVLDILQELAARAASQKEADAKALAEAKATLQAKDEVLAKTAASKTKLEIEIEKLKRLPGERALALRLAREKDAVATIDATMVKALGAMAEHLQALDTVLEAGTTTHTREYACNSARMLCEHIADLLAKHGIDVDLQQIVRPEWTRDVVMAQLAGGEG